MIATLFEKLLDAIPPIYKILIPEQYCIYSLMTEEQFAIYISFEAKSLFFTRLKEKEWKWMYG